MSLPPTSELLCLLDFARAAIEAHLHIPQTTACGALPQSMTGSRGVFVTLYEPNGQLRGCIGHIRPIMETLLEEVQTCAVKAASRDPRFAPVKPEEVPSLKLEVSILENPEPISGRDQLNPKEFGVIVRAGSKVGLLLPDIEGVDTIDYQLSIAMRKAGIAPSEDYGLERFKVIKIRGEVSQPGEKI